MGTAIITGGSRGLGLALARALLAEEWTVIIDGRDRSRLDEAAAGSLPGVVVVPGDVADDRHRQDLVAEARAHGGLDLLVNNAGTLGPSPLPRLADLPLAALMELLRVNVAAPLALVQLALPLLGSGGGAVVNITSDAAVEGYAGWGGYGASKAALEQLSKVLSVEEPGVRVWWFDPGDMRTDMHQAAYPGEDISDRPPPETVVPALLGLLASRPPSGRYRAADLSAEGTR